MTIDGPPENRPSDNTLSDGKLLLRSLAVDRIALYSPRSSSEAGLSGDDEGTSGGQNTYPKVLPLAVRKKERGSLAKKWETRVQQQKQEKKERKESQGKIIGSKLGDKPSQTIVGSNSVEKGMYSV